MDIDKLMHSIREEAARSGITGKTEKEAKRSDSSPTGQLSSLLAEITTSLERMTGNVSEDIDTHRSIHILMSVVRYLMDERGVAELVIPKARLQAIMSECFGYEVKGAGSATEVVFTIKQPHPGEPCPSCGELHSADSSLPSPQKKKKKDTD